LPFFCVSLIFAYVFNSLFALCRDLCHGFPFALIVPVLLVAPTLAAEPARLSGASEVVIRYDTLSRVVYLEAEMAAELALGDWEASLKTTLDEDIWDGLAFEITRDCESLEIGSRVRFEPHKDRFRDWRTEIAWALDALEIEIEHTLTRTRQWLTLQAAWAPGPLEIAARSRLRSTVCKPLVFYDARIQAEFPLCEMDTAIEVEVNEDGFDAATFELDDLVLARLPWLSLDVEVQRTVEGKILKISPTVTLGEMTCIELELEAHEGAGLAGALRLTELAFDFTLASVDVDATVLANPDDWIDDQYAASLTLEAEADLPRERRLETEITLFWEGASPESGVTRAMLLARFEPLEWISAWLEMDTRSGSGNLDSIALGAEISW